ncbi:MAG TPA: hypothetical protein VFV75_20730 [Candidatus Polarisedimenticolaceae bacterium]|nr:hypothetical protein [Candidatus Polarisedimenticolaceae bacterium]
MPLEEQPPLLQKIASELKPGDLLLATLSSQLAGTGAAVAGVGIRPTVEERK